MAATDHPAPSGAASTSPAAARTGGFRPDIEGLRAIAVGLVLLYHADLWPRQGFLGVDVFFVISGFLITGLLVRELDQTGTVHWGRFLARRARRLLPAAALVLVVTAVAAWFAVPGLRRHEVGLDIAGAAAYVVNWVLAGRAVDYLAADAWPSPVQHYWSLSVEEQFYVVWPLLLVVAVLALRRVRPAWLDRGPGGGPRLRVIGALLALICVPSLAWSVWVARTDPPAGYFPTTTRAWELGVGAALAIWLAGRHTAGSARVGAALGWVGLAAVVGAAILLPEGAAWPGAWALLPTVGTAALLYAGWAAPQAALTRALGSRPCLVVGALSYSLYLWHWPIRILGEWVILDDIQWWQRTLLVAASVLPAWLGYRYVELPIHRGRGPIGQAMARRVRTALVAGLALSLSGVAAGAALQLARSPFHTRPATGPVPPITALGANTLGDRPMDPPPPAPGEWVTPDPLEAGADRPDADVDRCQIAHLATEPVECVFGDPDGTTTIVLVGDSKAMQWLPALQQDAIAKRWRIVTFGKSACTFSRADALLHGDAFPECDEWDAAVMEELRRLRPDVVVTSANADVARYSVITGEAALVAGYTARWTELVEMGAGVVVIGNNPSSPDTLDACAARHPDDLGQCAFDRARATERIGLRAMRTAALSVPGVRHVDLTSWICPGERCPVVIGHVTVNRGGAHVTATYAATLASRITPVVEAVRRAQSATS